MLKIRRTSEIAQVCGANILFKADWATKEALMRRTRLWEEAEGGKGGRRWGEGETSKSCRIASRDFSLLLLSMSTPRKSKNTRMCLQLPVCLWLQTAAEGEGVWSLIPWQWRKGCVSLHAIGLVGGLQCKWHHIFLSDLLKHVHDVTAVSFSLLLFLSLCPCPPSPMLPIPLSLFSSFHFPISILFPFVVFVSSCYYFLCIARRQTHRNQD